MNDTPLAAAILFVLKRVRAILDGMTPELAMLLDFFDLDPRKRGCGRFIIYFHISLFLS
jgi:hypothetical protein